MTLNPRGPQSAEQIYRQTVQSKNARIPYTRAERVTEVLRRRGRYLAAAYEEADVRRLGLFRALDSGGNISADTLPVFRDLAFVANVDAGSIASNVLRLSVRPTPGVDEDPEAERIQAAAGEIWTGSEVDERRHMWARTVCTEGEALLEAVRTEAGEARIVMHPYETYELEYDALGVTIVRAVITRALPPEVKIMANGERAAVVDQPRSYVRVIERDQVRVWIDGVPVPGESAPNPLGIVPVARVQYMPVLGGEWSLCSAYGYEDAVASLDSLVRQLHTVLTRHANPLLKGIGVDVGSGASLQEQGRAVGIPIGTDLQWLEPVLQGITVGVSAMTEIRSAMVATLPQFLFTDSGASASGTALSYRAAAFVQFIDPIRSAFYRALARVIGYAVAIERGGAWTAAMDRIEVAGGPAIPQDVIAMAEAHAGLWTAGAITGADLARHLQSSGIASDDLSPADYSRTALAELAARSGETQQTVAQLSALLDQVREMEGRVDAPDEPDEPDDLEPDAADAEDSGAPPANPPPS